jgi:hypothetical protein
VSALVHGPADALTDKLHLPIPSATKNFEFVGVVGAVGVKNRKRAKKKKRKRCEALTVSSLSINLLILKLNTDKTDNSKKP